MIDEIDSNDGNDIIAFLKPDQRMREEGRMGIAPAWVQT